MSRYNYAVVIGRFQPFHNGHWHMLTQASMLADHVIVILGSANGPRTIKNPFSDAAREAMIRLCLTEYENKRFTFIPIEDSAYNDGAWEASVATAVDDIVLSAPTKNLPTVVHVAHAKDEGSTHVKMFPQWAYDEVSGFKANGAPLNATHIREDFFRMEADWTADERLPKQVGLFLNVFRDTDAYATLRREQAFIDAYKASWAAAPYPPTFVCVDAVVVQSSHILLIRRRAEPGKGLWALPGGFLNQHERIIPATIRELWEETRLKVPEAVLKGNIVITKVFDDPNRSLRGRTLTHASLIHLPARPEGLPPVRGSDDADKAAWIHLNDVTRDMMFDDHMDIILNMEAHL